MSEIISVFLTSLSPIAELRGAIPLGILVYKMNPVVVFLISIIGNIAPVIFLLLFLDRVKNFLLKQKSNFFEKIFYYLDKRTSTKFQTYFNRYKELGLLIFVAIPLPFTGAWSGALAASLFNIPKKQAFFLISGGVLIAGIIVLMLIELGIKVFQE